MDWVGAAMELGIEGLKLVNRELAEKYNKKKMTLVRQIAMEKSKPVYPDDIHKDTIDHIKIDGLEFELWLIKDAVLKELRNVTNASDS